MLMLKASFLVVVFSMGVLAPAIAQNGQNRKPRKKLKELLMKADSLRLQLRQSADRGRMLQWGDSLLMAELGKSKMSEKKKQRLMKHYVKIQRRLSLYDRQLFRGDSLLAANYYKILKSATYRVSWEFTCKTTKILLLYIFLGHNRNVVNTKFPYPIKRLEVIRWFDQKSMVFNQSLS